jgi:hypothetical protein
LHGEPATTGGTKAIFIGQNSAVQSSVLAAAVALRCAGRPTACSAAPIPISARAAAISQPSGAPVTGSRPPVIGGRAGRWPVGGWPAGGWPAPGGVGRVVPVGVGLGDPTTTVMVSALLTASAGAASDLVSSWAADLPVP